VLAHTLRHFAITRENVLNHLVHPPPRLPAAGGASPPARGRLRARTGVHSPCRE
jgi:hypothetical protein